MPLSKRDLLQWTSEKTYSRGAAYFNGNRVHLLLQEDGEIEAEVEGSLRQPYHVWVELSRDGNRLISCQCECPAFLEEYDGICKHIVATILQAQTLRPAPAPKRSDSGAVQMLNRYIRAVADKASESLGGQAILEPALEYDSLANAWLCFRVGERRLYAVQDLGALAQRLHNRESGSYGKYTLWHAPAAFREDSRPLLEFFQRRYNSYNYLYQQDGPFLSYGAGRYKRCMFLSPVMADEFFALWEGRELLTRNEAKQTASVPVVREDYRPRLLLKKTEGGARLELRDRILPVPGDKGLYILTESRLCCCGQAFADACGELLQALAKHQEKGLFFAEKELGVLFTVVLPGIAPFAELEQEGDFAAYRPLPLETKIYLDSAAPGCAEARMTFTYGTATFDAFGGKSVAQSQDLAGEIRAESLLRRYFGDTADQNGSLHIVDDPDALYRLLTEGLEELGAVGELYVSERFGGIRVHPPVSVSVGLRVEAELLRLRFSLEGLNLEELPGLLASYRARKKYHRLRDGSFLTLDGTALSGLSELAEGLDLSDKQLVSGQAELGANRALYLDAVCKRNEELRVDRDRAFKRILRDMKEVENADFPVPDSLHGVLRNYQKTGFRWLKTIGACGFGGILADDMGLGKTIQVLALLQSCREEPGDRLPSLVVCPSSLSLNWESEAQAFTPELRVCVVAGTAAERAGQIAEAGEQDLLITSYDLLKRDIERYEGISFAFVVIDEAQYIKNQSTQNAKAVKALRARRRFALTGTPVENSLAELWSIFDFLMPGYLQSYSRFKKRYEEPIVKKGSREAAERLKELVRPFLLRRLKRDVLKELPPKTETVLRSRLDEEQRKVYAGALAHAQKELRQRLGLAGQDRIAILAALTRLRQICCDPSLLYENYQGGSAKLEACLELVEGCVSSGRRILLFSQFTSMLDILEKRLAGLELGWLRIDGSTKPGRRLELVNAFNAGSIPLFLISLKAGGTGLNLTGADVVIHYDPWWNLSAQNQATDRAHRIGQKNRVQVYKLIAKDTIEEGILELQQKKAELADRVIEENGNPLEHLRGEELLALLEG